MIDWHQTQTLAAHLEASRIAKLEQKIARLRSTIARLEDELAALRLAR